MRADVILARLSDIRPRSAGKWIARCPAHEDRSPSLSIRELADGRTLVHCFAGCGTADILAAVGLDWQDLYPPREPGATPSRRPWAARYPAADLLEIVGEEVTIVASVAASLRTERAVSDEDWQRLATAVGRIQRVRDSIAPPISASSLRYPDYAS